METYIAQCRKCSAEIIADVTRLTALELFRMAQHIRMVHVDFDEIMRRKEMPQAGEILRHYTVRSEEK